MTASLVLFVVVLAAAPGQAPGAAPCDYACAAALVERGSPAEAIPALEALVAARPADLRSLNLLGIALTSAGRPVEGRAAFARALARDPAFVAARKNLAVNEFASGRIAEAGRHFRRVLRQSPDDPVAHAFLGEIAFRQGNCAAALGHYARAGDRVRSRPDWLLHQATCLLDTGDRAAAAALFEALPEAEGDARFAAGVALGRAGAHAEAARFFRSARLAGHDLDAAGFNEILMLVEAGQPAAAIAVGAELLAEGPRPAEFHNLLARAYAGTGRIQEAYDALRAAVRLEPSNQAHYLDLAMLCLDHENFDLALEIADIGLAALPGSAALRLQRGVALVMKGRMDDAAAEFEKARALDPAAPGPPIALAMAWMQSGRTADAVATLRARAKADPASAAVQHMLGVAIMRSGAEPDSGEAAEALGAFERAARLDPALAGAHAELGKLLLKRDEVAKAVTALQRAVALDPESASAAYALAQAYRRSGDVDQARTLLERVTALNARERGDDPERELRRLVVRIIREGTGRHGTP